jgi:N-acetylmuramic acid 6-phosphate etherase
MREARANGALTIALTNNLPAPLAEHADLVIAPLVGPEVLTGSTRLKAGSSQKMVLNMISTGVMVRLGKTYGNLMVDVQQLNRKLKQRARRIVAHSCGIGEEEADEVLSRADGDVKTAIVSFLADCTTDEAKGRLEETQGVVRAAVAKQRRASKV